MLAKLLDYIEKNKAELFDLLCKTIELDTQNSGTDGLEKPLAEYMHKYFESIGVESDIYSPDDVPGLTEHDDYLAGRNLDHRPNVTAKLAGSNPKKALMLAGHIDTVPIGDLSLWTVDPLKGTIKNGNIYGRGACDDKFALAVEMFLAKAFKDLGIKIKNDVYLTGYVDEEFGGGDGALACCVKYPCDFYINMDSDYMDIIHSGVGGQRLAINLKHPDLLDSCEIMIEGIYITKKIIDKFGDRRKDEMSKNIYYKYTDIPKTALRYMNVVTGLNTNDRNRGVVDFAYYTDSPKEQIVAEYEEMFDEIRTAIAPLGLVIDSITYRSRFFKYAVSDRNHKYIKLLNNSAKKLLNRDLKLCGMCLSDLNLFINLSGGNAVSCGVCRGFADEGGSHQPDENVNCDELVDLAKLMAQFIFDWDAEN